MKTRIIALVIVMALSRAVNGQEIYQIVDTKSYIRYYKEFKCSVEKLNDSLSVSMARRGQSFELSLLNDEGKVIFKCMYKYAGKYRNQIRTTRVNDTDGTRLVKKVIKVKMLTPVKENCIKEIMILKK